MCSILQNTARSGDYRQLVASEGCHYYYDVYRNFDPEMTPIVFVCNSFQGINSCKGLIDYFREMTTVITVDVPAPGAGKQSPASYNFDYFSTTLAKILDVEDLDQIYLVSTSYGIPVAYQLVRKHSNKMDKLLLAGVMQTIPEVARKNIFHPRKK